MYKRILSWGIMLICFVVLATMAYALPVTIEEVKIDNDVIQTGVTNVLELERGQELDVKIRIKGQGITTADKALDHVQVEAELKGTEFKDVISDSTESFKVREGVSVIKRLKLRLPSRLEQDKFKLRVRVEDRDGDTTQNNYEIEVAAKRHQVTIRDIILNPENEVRAGKTLIASARLKNTGQKDEKGVRIKFSIPELGVSATEYVNELEREDEDNDQATSNGIFLRIPDDAQTGTYTLKAEITFREGDEVVTKDTKVRVIGKEDDTPSVTAPESKKKEKVVISVGIDKQSINAGAEAVYPITIINDGTESKAFVVSVDSVSWGTTKVTPSSVAVVNGGESKTVNVQATANSNAPEGEQTFVATVMSGEKMLKQILLKATVAKSAAQPSTGFKLKTVLEVLTLVLLVLVIIILLVFGLSRVMQKDEEGKDKDEETYY